MAKPAILGICLLLAIRCNGPDPESGLGKPLFSPVLSATAEEVRAFLTKGQGGPRSKLVYVDLTGPRGVLCYLDFSSASGVPEIRRIAAAEDPKVPVISPDGNWVVYASGRGAEAGSPTSARSSVFLIRLDSEAHPVLLAADSGCEPRFVQKAPPGVLGVIYSTLAPNFGWEGFGRTLRVDVDLSGNAPAAGPPVVVNADGSYTGGLSWDERYLCGGGGHVAMLDLASGRRRPDTLSLGMIQSCNASISSSRRFTDALMYLNTSGSHARVNGGEPWSEWQAILIGDRGRRLLRGYMPPAAFRHPLETDPPSLASARWHHNEWSNHPYFAAAALNADRYFPQGGSYANTAFQERVYLLDLKDSSYLEVLRPDTVAYAGKSFGGLFWPWLWVEVPPGFEEEPDWLTAQP